MRQSKLFASTLRVAPAEAEVASHRLLLKAGFIRQLAAGIYTYMPLGWRVLRKIEHILREELDRAGAQELHMPAMQPMELWKESGRHNAYGPELIRIFDRHQREFALGPTHEEVITILAKNEIHSYRRLPVTVYQIQTKFRDERRPRFGLLRAREFIMKDAYSFDSSWEGLDRSYRAMYEAYHRIFSRCGLSFRAVEADAGAIGGEGDTHEFMAMAEIGEDTIVVCSICGYAANVEKATSKESAEGQEYVSESAGDSRSVKEGDSCSHCEEGKLRFAKGIEVGHVFKLGTKYSEALGARYADENGREQPLIMGCYGIGVSRIVSAIVEQNHDDRGIVWPEAIAPYRVHLIPVSINDETHRKVAEDLYDALRRGGVEVLFDDREERAGVKFNDSDLIGVPIRLVVGKDAVHGQVEYVERRAAGKQLLSIDDALERIRAGG